MKKLSLVFFFVLIGALSFGALVTDYDITSGTKGAVYDLGDSTLNYHIDGADLIAGNIGAIISGGFHGATQPPDDPSRLASITDSLFAIPGLTVIAADSAGGYDLVIEYTLAMPANVTDILIFSGHADSGGSRAWINADVMIDSGAGFYTLKQNLKTGPYGQAPIGGIDSAVAVVRLFDDSGPNARIAGSVQKIRIGFYCVSHNSTGTFKAFDDNSPPENNYPNQGTIIKEIDVLGYEDLGVKINEVVWDDPSTDNEEFIELFGPPSMSLAGWTLELINGNGGAPYTPSPIALTAIPADGYLVISYSPATCPNQDIAVPGFTVQNGSPDAIRLRDPFGTIQDALGYEMLQGPGGLIAGTDYEGPGFYADIANQGWSAWDYSLQRVLDGYDTDDNERDFALLGTTPGLSNQTSKGYIPYANDFDDTAGVTQYGEWWGYWVDLSCQAPGGEGLPPVASPQGGNIAVAADITGGYNTVVLTDRATTDVSMEFYLYLRDTLPPAGESEEGAIQVRGSTRSYLYNAPNAAGESDKGIVWFLKADDSGSTLSLQERYAGQVLQTYLELPIYGTGRVGWQRVRVDCIGNSVMGVVGGNLGDTGGDFQVFGTTTFPAGGTGLSYYEHVTALADASFLSIDALRINNTPSTVVPVELSVFQIE